MKDHNRTVQGIKSSVGILHILHIIVPTIKSYAGIVIIAHPTYYMEYDNRAVLGFSSPIFVFEFLLIH